MEHPILDPCCGGEAIEVRTGGREDIMRRPLAYWVRCSECDAETALCDSMSEAIAAWNRRVTQNIWEDECWGQPEEQEV